MSQTDREREREFSVDLSFAPQWGVQSNLTHLGILPLWRAHAPVQRCRAAMQQHAECTTKTSHACHSRYHVLVAQVSVVTASEVWRVRATKQGT